MTNLLKKYTLVFSIFLIVSCSSDDGNNNSQPDPIIGFWEYSTQFLNNIETTVNDCQRSTIEFTENGNRTDLYYDDNLGDCIIVDTVSMAWEYLENDSYQFTHNGFSYTVTITFENENHTLIFEDSDTDGNGGTNLHRFVYNRVN